MFKEIPTTITASAFWQSVNILITKSHVVNKRVWGSMVLHKCNCKPVTTNILNWCLPDHCGKVDKIDNVDLYLAYLLANLQLQQCDISDSDDVIEIILSELLPKNYSDIHAVQLTCLQKDRNVVTFYDVTPKNENQNVCPNYSYSLQLNSNMILLKANCDLSSKSFQWLLNTVLPQFVKWGQECVNTKPNSQFCSQSLAFVSIDKYYSRYNELKLKYGKEMVKIWPECTDPSKFVYEDVAIATYLLLLWEEERAQQGSNILQSFVDLGCGNGLLVYILSKEGHPGVGIDVRKRQIWDMFGANVKLEEKTITPSDTHLFPDTDWIIGNHSDELTPWIPVISARSSYKCNFFLLPCCAYNFDGTKYQRQNSSKSQYTEYLEHIKQLCEDIGFKTDVDRLKIPSTKRICLLGRGRRYEEKAFEDQCNQIRNLIDKEQVNRNENVWINDFKPRDPVEKVKNCTHIDKNLIQSIVGSITYYLLEGCNVSNIWNSGKVAGINELVQLIPHDQLKALKSECGGLQTLLKNNHHIFKVQSGRVQLRYPKTVEEVKKDSQYKKNKAKSGNIRIQFRPCWFYNHHPQGCPLSDDKCSFLHAKS
ncbi:probable tRNA (uracil-O(2)-)-methyltransferase isoform X1 [Cydia strobilella]|uniref:probable tRNA (uracil-O(2)-)-methyltransferase isoform X1 n=1 Tax=Cydia strobilella TaxID=1100964 RepID=UPI0030070118